MLTRARRAVESRRGRGRVPVPPDGPSRALRPGAMGGIGGALAGGCREGPSPVKSELALPPQQPLAEMIYFCYFVECIFLDCLEVSGACPCTRLVSIKVVPAQRVAHWGRSWGLQQNPSLRQGYPIPRAGPGISARRSH